MYQLMKTVYFRIKRLLQGVVACIMKSSVRDLCVGIPAKREPGVIPGLPRSGNRERPTSES